MTSLRTLPLALLVLAPFAAADTIFKTDGTAIEECTVVTEGVNEVTYKLGKKEKTVASDEVLRVEFVKVPAEIDRALAAIKEQQLLAAVDDLILYHEGISAGKKERREWAPPYALGLLVDQFKTMGETEQVLKYTDILIKDHPESRYVPYAYLTRAQVLFEKGEAGKAKAAIESFAGVVDEKQLSKRWQLESDLGLVLYDTGLDGAERRERLVIVSSNAGSEFPTVRNRADVAEGESLLADKQFADAEKIFERIAKGTGSDNSTRAAAFCGLGDCLFQKASSQGAGSDEQRATLKSALMSYLRVAINYKNETRYVSKALFFAARSFDLMGEDQSANAQKLYLRVIRNYGESQWAKESKSFVKR